MIKRRVWSKTSEHVTYMWGKVYVDFIQIQDGTWTILIASNIELEGLTSLNACESWFDKNQETLNKRYVELYKYA